MKQFLLFISALCATIAFVTGCANQGSGPDGGPFDEHPPRIVSMTPPEKVTGSKRTKFTLVFDELIKVDNPTEKIIVSPPQRETPEIKVSGRSITVEILDTIQPNTTYTVDFSDAITDNNEGNPLGQYTYIFSTGVVTDTMEISGHVLNADDLEPLKGVLVGLHESGKDSAFNKLPFERVARTDASGFFSIKGVSKEKKYRIFALQDADADFKFSQRGEMIGFLDKDIIPGAFPDVRYDTAWVDSVRYDSIRTIHYTHFTPDDVVVTAFKESLQPRHFLKAVREVPESFRTFFTARSAHAPTIKGINFNAERAFVEDRNLTNDTITYWIADTTLLRQDSLRMAYSYEAWDDSLQKTYLKTDTLELVPRLTFAKRAEQQKKDLEKFEKQRERRHKRGDFSQETLPPTFLPVKFETRSKITPIDNVVITTEHPLAQFDRSKLRLELKVDTLFEAAPYELDSIPGKILSLRLRAEWRPGQEYRLTLDSAAMCSVYGQHNNKVQTDFGVGKSEDYGALFLTLQNATNSMCVQLLNTSGAVEQQVDAKNGRAEFYYLQPGNFYVRAYNDRNGDKRWTPGEWSTHTPAEEMYYHPELINVRENWDVNQDWDVTRLPLTQQKPRILVKQKTEKREVNTHQRNIERLRKRGKGE